jgi:DNA helicase-2/ATP-dependent DNA helicase PcrA
MIQMKFIGDFHIHSHFSIATSRNLTPEYLDFWARLKGIQVVGTGDFTHPGWSAELKEKLEPAEPGLFRLRDGLRREDFPLCGKSGTSDVRFLLTAEISSIYKKDDRVRKVHNVIFSPDFETVESIQRKLTKIGNITSDGRPILGLDSRDLLEIALEASDRIFFVPAHIWTPWFSALGAKSGFDTIKACYRDLADSIYAVETGLSSDPAMNWMCRFLDDYTLISNSDAHSPEKLGREANLFDTELSYEAIIQAVKTGDPKQFLGTVEFFPQEGKYHYDGHRKCGICWDPVETLKNDSKCPVCGKTVTVGVMSRVAELSDREDPAERKNKAPFYSIIPLKEILAEISGVGPDSKQVAQAYHSLLKKAGSEFHVLLHLNLDDLKKAGDAILVEAIRRMRCGEVRIQEGFDGEFGRIRVFNDMELQSFRTRDSFFTDLAQTGQDIHPEKLPDTFDMKLYRNLRQEKGPPEKKEGTEPEATTISDGLNSEQRAAVEHGRGPALIVAGPGTGKTRVLTSRIAYLITHEQVLPDHILAVTFTNKAAGEMKTRLRELMIRHSAGSGPNVSTFHAFGYQVLKAHPETVSRDGRFSIMDEEEKSRLLVQCMGFDKNRARQISCSISSVKQNGFSPDRIADKELSDLFVRYQALLQKENSVDLDDLIYYPVQMFMKNPDLLSKYRTQYPWILVDEFQDINAVQYQLIRLLMPGDNADLYVVGDPHQAIYGFRGADVRCIRFFIKDYPKAITYRLMQSYRCSGTILRASGGVIREETGEDDLLNGLHEGVKIQIARHPSDKSEAEFVARSIERMLGGLRFFSMDSDIVEGSEKHEIHSLSDIAVLCRVGRQMEVLEKAFRDHSIPYQTVDETPFYKQEPIKSILDLLRIAVNPVNEFLKNTYSDRKGIALPDKTEMERFIRGKTVRQILEEMIQVYFEAQRELNAALLKELLDGAVEFGDDLNRFLTFTAIGTGVDVYRPDVENVALMTLHAAKGLEFECVFITGCEEGLLPYSLFESQTIQREEERRLLYVGMTRAKKFLFLTHAEERFLFGREHRLSRSSFLELIEEGLIEFSKSEKKKKDKKENNQINLF